MEPDPNAPTVRRTPPSSDTHPTLPAAAAQAPAGDRFGKFVRTEKLGAGGMGEVWKAWDAELARWVALKFLKGGDDSEIARFKREAQTAGRLAHPHIAAIYEVCEDAGRHFIAMQYVEGRTLKACPRLRDAGAAASAAQVRTDRRVLVGFLRDAARAVAFANQQGIVHRDLKPENVMVSGAGHVYVMDFGLARSVEGQHSASGAIVGSPAYMAPEQARGGRFDARTDVYALGATLYELLTDRVPFKAATVVEVLRMVQDEEPPVPRAFDRNIDADLETIVLKCLEKDPSRRYATAGDLADDLDRYLNGEAIAARRASLGYRLRMRLAKRKAVVIGTVLALAAVAAAANWLVADSARRRNERELAERKQREEVARAALDRARTHVESGRRVVDQMRVVMTDPACTPEEMSGLAGRSEAEFRKALAEVPDLPEALLGIGTAWRLARDRKRALDAVERAIAAAPAFAPAYLDRVRILIDDYEDMRHDARPMAESAAARDLRERLERDLRQVDTYAKGSVERLYGRALLAFAEGDYLRAQELLEEHLRASPADAEALTWRGHALVHLGRWDVAEAILARAIACDARNVDAYLARGYGRIERRLYGDAIADLTKALEIRPRSPGALVTRGTARLRSGDGRGALEDATKALSIAPRFAKAFVCRAAALDELGDWREAIAAADRALEVDRQSAYAWVHRGRARDHLGDSGGAVEDCTKAIEIDPRLAIAYLSRGEARSTLGDTDGAMQDWTLAIELDPTYTNALSHRGGERAVRGEFAGAVDDCTRAIESSPRFAEAWRNRGRARIWLKAIDEAIADLTKAIELDPRDNSAWFFRGIAHLHQKDPRAARADFDEAVKLDPRHASYYYNRGVARGELKDFEGAGEDYTKAIELDLKYAEAYANRGSLRQSRDDRKGAAEDYAKALEVAPPDWSYRAQVERLLRQVRPQ